MNRLSIFTAGRKSLTIRLVWMVSVMACESHATYNPRFHPACLDGAAVLPFLEFWNDSYQHERKRER
jgi:hypothetical protein